MRDDKQPVSTANPPQVGDRLTLTVASPQHGLSSGQARVVLSDPSAIVLDLAACRYLSARCERGAPAQLLVIGPSTVRIGATRVLGRPPGVSPRCAVDTPTAWTDRSRGPRAELRVPVVGIVVDGGRPFEGETIDISEGGLCLLTSAPPPAGAAVALRIPVPGGTMATVHGLVIESEPPHLGGPPSYVVRCRFTTIGPMVRHLIASFVATGNLYSSAAG